MISSIQTSEMFHEYEQEFFQWKEKIEKGLQTLKQPLNQDQNQTNQIAFSLNEADKCLRQMEMELSSLPPQNRQNENVKLRTMRTQLETHKKNFQKAQIQIAQQQINPRSMSGRDQMIQNTQQLYKQGDRIEDMTSVALQAETVGANTMITLKQQREQLIRVDQKVQDTSTNTGKASQIIDSMAKREFCIKVGMIIAIVLLIIANICALLIKIRGWVS